MYYRLLVLRRNLVIVNATEQAAVTATILRIFEFVTSSKKSHWESGPGMEKSFYHELLRYKTFYSRLFLSSHTSHRRTTMNLMVEIGTTVDALVRVDHFEV